MTAREASTITKNEEEEIPPLQRACCVDNFRQVAGTSNVYRCAAPDGLTTLLDDPNSSTPSSSSAHLHEAERILLQDVTMIVDLRIASERNSASKEKFYEKAGFVVVNDEEGAKQQKRCCLHVDLLTAIFTSPNIREKVAEFNSRGLIVLHEMMFQLVREEFCSTLKLITVHLEADTNNKVIVHCTQGKDRTGMLCMLLQAIAGVSDDEIIADYAKSSTTQVTKEVMRQVLNTGPQAALDTNVLSSISPECMILTLDYVKQEYGSMNSFLDLIGFDETWRQRLSSALVVAN